MQAESKREKDEKRVANMKQVAAVAGARAPGRQFCAVQQNTHAQDLTY